MAHCYVCGAPIRSDRRHPRRKVRVGEWTRRVPSDPSGWTVRSNLGMRVVCGSCAHRIDRREREAELVWLAKVFAALVAAAVFAVCGAGFR